MLWKPRIVSRGIEFHYELLTVARAKQAPFVDKISKDSVNKRSLSDFSVLFMLKKLLS
jgi:hypothetical protein